MSERESEEHKIMGRWGSTNDNINSEIKFAGNDNKVKMYEPKHKRKLVRVFTVVAYVFSVSLAGIILSLFYIFIYSPGKAWDAKKEYPRAHEDFTKVINATANTFKGEEPILLLP